MLLFLQSETLTLLGVAWWQSHGFPVTIRYEERAAGWRGAHNGLPAGVACAGYFSFIFSGISRSLPLYSSAHVAVAFSSSAASMPLSKFAL